MEIDLCHHHGGVSTSNSDHVHSALLWCLVAGVWAVNDRSSLAGGDGQELQEARERKGVFARVCRQGTCRVHFSCLGHDVPRLAECIELCKLWPESYYLFYLPLVCGAFKTCHARVTPSDNNLYKYPTAVDQSTRGWDGNTQRMDTCVRFG